ncbi:transglutaminase domain-containing protein [Flavobacterium granuli]|uniref:Transglutaminase superfamily protein n=1 Tax=Flavobacterium granuli TaxID=280093 RepID=A0A1M5MKC6_9FLAO|nr:transglutaminase domain-containing protein [Flavobacterium granuli]PRZ24989.1 transglutaminase superfamily protein [Flavobacterium granuli]SHG77904.1 Transglutaminase-like superfamily protein [Flavobacterium granuli]
MRHTLLLLSCFCSFFVLAQKKQKIQNNYDLIDAKMDKMPLAYAQSMDSVSHYIKSNFETESDKIRAVFYWTANTISYDTENMFLVNFEEKPQDRVVKILNTKKGICVDYANVFKEIANLLGMKTFVVQGYVKTNGVVNNLAHVWNAAKIDDKWYLFDPTWGSGYVINGVFTRRINNEYFKADPEIMINTHMPFDYLWQFREYPIGNQEFINGVYLGDDTKQKFDFVNEIIRLESLSRVDQCKESIVRIEKGGMKNQHVSQAYISKKRELMFEEDNVRRVKFEKVQAKFREVANQFSMSIVQLNNFIDYRNKRFQPPLPDKEIKRMIQEPIDRLLDTKDSILYLEENIDEQNRVNLEGLKSSIAQTLERSDKHLQFVKTYLATKSGSTGKRVTPKTK